MAISCNLGIYNFLQIFFFTTLKIKIKGYIIYYTEINIYNYEIKDEKF